MVTRHPTNWAGNIVFSAADVITPATLPQLQQVVASSSDLRVLGTGHSFNRIADCAGDLVSVAGLPPVSDIDTDRAVVQVSAGTRYGELTGRLNASGFALPNLGSLPHISIAGACATGTHGSGNRNGCLATAVSAVELVTAEGDLVEVSRDSAGDEFGGVVLALGALGVVTSLTLDLVAAFDVAQYVYDDLPGDELYEHFDEVTEAGYSVSLFTDWRRTGAKQVWLKRQVDSADWQPPETWLGATLADGPRHPIPGMPERNCTEQLGVAGAWHERLPHFRLDFTPSSGDELQSEYLLPRGDAVAALTALAAVRERIAPLLQISEIRTVARDDMWLSPFFQRDTVGVHFTWVGDEPAVRPVLPVIEDLLAPFGARPHWGKVFTTPPDAVRGLFPRLPDVQRLLEAYDPKGTFANEFVRTYVLGR